MSMKELIRKYASLLIAGFIAAGAAASASAESAPASSAGTKSFVLQQIRNATIKIDYGDVRFLVDPMLAKKAHIPRHREASTAKSATLP